MSVTQTAIGMLAVGGLLTLSIQTAAPEPPPVLVVHSIEHDDGMVSATRTYNGDGEIMDWRVSIVSAQGKAPSCATIVGDKQHEGWSEYDPFEDRTKVMSLDDWVGQDGCYEALKEQPGTYNEYITWTPRNGRDPVTYIGQIVID